MHPSQLLSAIALGLAGISAHAAGEIPLDHLKLTPAEVRARDARIEPLLQATYGSKNTIGSVVNAIEKEYAISVYHDGVHTANLKDKRGIMTSFIKDMLCERNPLEGIMESERPLKCSLNLGATTMPVGMPRISGKFLEESNCRKDLGLCYASNRFMIFSQTMEVSYYGALDLEHERKYLVSSTTAPLSANDKPLALLRALKETEIRALDATIILSAQRASSFYGQPDGKVIYPNFSRYAPIPTPVIVIGSSMTKDEIKDLIQSNAARIHAYNELLERNLLPTNDDLDAYLAKFPAVSEELQKMIRTSDRQRMRAALMDSFLTASYFGMMGIAIPVAAAATVATGAVALPFAGVGALAAMAPAVAISAAVVVAL